MAIWMMDGRGGEKASGEREPYTGVEADDARTLAPCDVDPRPDTCADIVAGVTPARIAANNDMMVSLLHTLFSNAMSDNTWSMSTVR